MISQTRSLLYTPPIQYLILAMIIYDIIAIIIGIFIIRWWAIKKDWDDSYKPPIIIMVILMIIGNIIWLPLQIIIGPSILTPILIYLISLLVGSILIFKLYEKEFKESMIFALITITIMLVIFLILSFTINVIMSAIYGVPVLTLL